MVTVLKVESQEILTFDSYDVATEKLCNEVWVLVGYDSNERYLVDRYGPEGNLDHVYPLPAGLHGSHSVYGA